MKITVESTDQCTVLNFSGQLNESSTSLQDIAVDPTHELHLRVKNVTAINSVGIRQFQIWISKIQCQKIRVFQCPKNFVFQLNMVKDFLPPRAIIESFYVPYFSEISGEERSILVNREIEYIKTEKGIVLNLPIIMDKNSNPMELDIVKEKYFRFLEFYS